MIAIKFDLFLFFGDGKFVSCSIACKSNRLDNAERGIEAFQDYQWCICAILTPAKETRAICKKLCLQFLTSML